MESDAPHTELVATLGELCLIVRSQREWGVTAPDHLLPGVAERRARAAQIARDENRPGVGRRHGCSRR